ARPARIDSEPALNYPDVACTSTLKGLWTWDCEQDSLARRIGQALDLDTRAECELFDTDHASCWIRRLEELTVDGVEFAPFGHVHEEDRTLDDFIETRTMPLQDLLHIGQGLPGFGNDTARYGSR